MLRSMADVIQTMAGSDVVVRYAHMELADPTIAAGFSSCVEAGATDVTVFPYMLSPGRHSTSDIPRMVADVARAFPSVNFTVTPAFGLHEKLAEVVLERAGIGAAIHDRLVPGDGGRDRCAPRRGPAGWNRRA